MSTVVVGQIKTAEVEVNEFDLVLDEYLKLKEEKAKLDKRLKELDKIVKERVDALPIIAENKKYTETDFHVISAKEEHRDVSAHSYDFWNIKITKRF